MSTLGNEFGQVSVEYGSGKNIWHEVKGMYPVGGNISNYSDFAGSVIPAGSMCVYDQSEKTVAIATADAITAGTYSAEDVNGLLYHDVYVRDTATYATGAVVYAGEIYSDRLDETVPDDVWENLPMIVQVKEA